MDPILQLKNRTPLTHGRSRLVYEHPDDPDLLIKVIRPEVIENRFGNNTKWYKKRRRYGKFVSYVRETQEFLAVWEASGADTRFLQRIVGFARTDMGLGLVMEAVRSADGKLAPSLAMLIKSGRFDQTAQSALTEFLDKLLRSPVIISDLSLGNLVYTYTKDQGHYFVLIDGLGNNSLLPFKAISKFFNRRSKLGRFKRLHARIERAQAKKQERKA